MLEVGTKAPNFTLPDQDAKDVSLSDFAGKKVVLWFFPKASTPGWTIEGQGFRDERQKFEDKNTVVIGMSADPPKKQKNFCDKQGFEYSMLCDEGKDVLKAYGVWGEKKLYGREYEGISRITYVIDESGNISHVYPKVSVKTHAQDILGEL
jgi:peroxiredoxin Q/BCP